MEVIHPHYYLSPKGFYRPKTDLPPRDSAEYDDAYAQYYEDAAQLSRECFHILRKRVMTKQPFHSRPLRWGDELYPTHHDFLPARGRRDIVTQFRIYRRPMLSPPLDSLAEPSDVMQQLQAVTNMTVHLIFALSQYSQDGTEFSIGMELLLQRTKREPQGTLFQRAAVTLLENTTFHPYYLPYYLAQSTHLLSDIYFPLPRIPFFRISELHTSKSLLPPMLQLYLMQMLFDILRQYLHVYISEGDQLIFARHFHDLSKFIYKTQKPLLLLWKQLHPSSNIAYFKTGVEVEENDSDRFDVVHHHNMAYRGLTAYGQLITALQPAIEYNVPESRTTFFRDPLGFSPR